MHLRQEVCHSSLTSALTARFNFVRTMLAVRKIDKHNVDFPQFVAFEGASRENNSSSFNFRRADEKNLWRKRRTRIGGEETPQAQREDRRRRAPFYLESPLEFIFTWNSPLCAVLLLLLAGGGGGGMSIYHQLKQTYTELELIRNRVKVLFLTITHPSEEMGRWKHNENVVFSRNQKTWIQFIRLSSIPVSGVGSA